MKRSTERVLRTPGRDTSSREGQPTTPFTEGRNFGSHGLTVAEAGATTTTTPARTLWPPEQSELAEGPTTSKPSVLLKLIGYVSGKDVLGDEDVLSAGTSIGPRAAPVKAAIREAENLRSSMSKQATINKRVGFIGKTGIGKSTTINNLLQMTEVEDADYGEGSNYPEDPTTFLEQHSVKTTPRKLHHDVMANPACTRIILVPGMNEFSMEDILNEQKAVDAKKVCIFGTNVADFTEMNCRPFIVPTAAPDVTMPTTNINIEICHGNNYAVTFEYQTESELREELGGFDFLGFAANDDGRNVSERKAELKRYKNKLESLLDWSKIIGRDGRPIGKYNNKDPWFPRFVRDDQTEDDTFNPGEDLVFKDLVCALEGKTITARGGGQDKMKDRMFVRRVLNALLVRGIAEEKWCDILGDSTKTMPLDLFLIKRVVIYVPSFLLKEGIVLVDVPGCNDTNPLRSHEINESLRSCVGVIAMSEKESITADEALRNVLANNLAARLVANNGRQMPLVFYAIMAERENVKSKDTLRNKSVKDFSDEEETLAEELLKPSNMSEFGDENDLARVKTMIRGQINVVRPTAHSAIIMNGDERFSSIDDCRQVVLRTNMDALIKFILRVALGDVVDEVGAASRRIGDALLEVNPDSRAAALDKSFSLNLERARANFTTWWGEQHFREKVDRALAAYDLADVQRIIPGEHANLKKYFKIMLEGVYDTMDSSSPSLMVLSVIKAFTQKTTANLRRRTKVLPSLCDNVECIPINVKEIQARVSSILAEFVYKQVFEGCSTATLFPESKNIGEAFAAYIKDREGMAIKDAIIQTLYEEVPDDELTKAIQEELTAHLYATFQPILKDFGKKTPQGSHRLGKYEALKTKLNEGIKVYAEGVPRSFVRSCAKVLTNALRDMVPRTVSTKPNNHLMKVFQRFFRESNLAKSQNILQGAVNVLREFQNKLDMYASYMTTWPDRMALAIEARAMEGFERCRVSENLWALRLEAQTVFTGRISDGLFPFSPFFQEPFFQDLSKLHEAILARNERKRIDAVFMEVLGIQRDQGRIFDKVANQIPIFIDALFFRMSDDDMQRRFGFKLSEFASEIRRHPSMPNDEILKVRRNYLTSPHYHALWLQGACDAFRVALRVKIVPESVKYPPIFIVPGTAAMHAKVHVYDMTFNVETGEWSTSKLVDNARPSVAGQATNKRVELDHSLV